MTSELFRANAITQAGIRHFGDARLTLSPGLKHTAVILVTVVALAALTLANTTYERRQIVTGSIDESNLSTIVTASFGTMGKVLVEEGEFVSAGQYLGSILSLERQSATEPEYLEQLDALEQLETVLNTRRQQADARYEATERRLKRLQHIAQQDVHLQRQKMKLLEKQVEQTRALHESGYLSNLDWISFRASLITEKQNLNSSEQALLSWKRQREESFNEFQRTIDSISREQLETGIRRSQLRAQLDTWKANQSRGLYAAADGRVSRIMINPGDTVLPGTKVLHISSPSSRVTGTAYLPPDVAAHLTAGETLRLKVNSQTSDPGWLNATVLNVSEHKVAHPEHGSAHVARLLLSDPDGHREILPGTRFQSSIETERKRLLRWLLDPLANSSFSWN